MPDCFISYSNVDESLARFVAKQIRSQGLNPFMALISLGPGEDWAQAIKRNLAESSWVILLASRAACDSPFVHQEAGAAIFGGKRLVPVVWDMSPSELPGWIGRFQALDLRGATYEILVDRITRIAEAIKADKRKGALIAGAIFAGLLWLASKE